MVEFPRTLYNSDQSDYFDKSRLLYQLSYKGFIIMKIFSQYENKYYQVIFDICLYDEIIFIAATI